MRASHETPQIGTLVNRIQSSITKRQWQVASGSVNHGGVLTLRGLTRRPRSSVPGPRERSGSGVVVLSEHFRNVILGSSTALEHGELVLQRRSTEFCDCHLHPGGLCLVDPPHSVQVDNHVFHGTH